MIDDFINFLSSTNKWLFALAAILLTLNLIKELSFRRWARKYYTFIETDPYLFPVLLLNDSIITLRDGSVRNIRELRPDICTGIYPDDRVRSGTNFYTQFHWEAEFLPAAIKAEWYSFADEKYYKGEFVIPPEAMKSVLQYFSDTSLLAFSEWRVFLTYVLRYEPGGHLGLFVKGKEDIRFVCRFCASSYTPEHENRPVLSEAQFAEERGVAVAKIADHFPIVDSDQFAEFLRYAESTSNIDSLYTFCFYSYMSPEELLENLQDPALDVSGCGEVVGHLIYGAIFYCHSMGNTALIPLLVQAAIDYCEHISSHLRECLAGNILNSVIRGHIANVELQQQVFHHLIPEKVTVGLLAFNLACFYSRAKNKELVLKYTAIALDKRFSRRCFDVDEDFTFYRNDADFKRLINQPPSR